MCDTLLKTIVFFIIQWDYFIHGQSLYVTACEWHWIIWLSNNILKVLIGLELYHRSMNHPSWVWYSNFIFPRVYKRFRLIVLWSSYTINSLWFCGEISDIPHFTSDGEGVREAISTNCYSQLRSIYLSVCLPACIYIYIYIVCVLHILFWIHVIALSVWHKEQRLISYALCAAPKIQKCEERINHSLRNWRQGFLYRLRLLLITVWIKHHMPSNVWLAITLYSQKPKVVLSELV